MHSYVAIVTIQVEGGAGIMDSVIFIGDTIGHGIIITVMIQSGCCMGNFVVCDQSIDPGWADPWGRDAGDWQRVLREVEL